MLRRSECVLLVYFSYAAVVSLFLPTASSVRVRIWTVNAAIGLAYLALAYVERRRGGLYIGVTRDWFPLPLTLLCYKEMGWLRPAVHTYVLERQWVVWDRLILNEWHGRAVVEALGAVGPSILEIAYTLVYVTAAFAVAMLYVYGYRERVDRLWVVLLLGLLLSYAQFPFWPSEPPRTVFPSEDLPRIASVFRRLNLFLVGEYGIHTSVFPSAHVSGGFSAAFGLWRLLPAPRWPSRALLAVAILIAIATVYGRYHYAVDAVAGFVVSLAAVAISWIWERRDRRLDRARVPT